MVLTIKAQQSGIILSLKKDGRTFTEEVDKAEKILEGLDKLLKRNKIESVNDIKDLKTECTEATGVTSSRIVEIVVRGLKLTRQLN